MNDNDTLLRFFDEVKKGNISCVNNLLNENHSLIYISNVYDFTALHYATIYNKKQIAMMLVEKGADIHKSNHREMSNLHFAAKNGHKDLYEYFVELGCNPFQLNVDGLKPYELASSDIEYYKQFDDKLTVSDFDIFYNPSLNSKVSIPTLNLTNKCMLLCPGIGILKKGIISKYIKLDSVRVLFEEANNILGFDITRILLHGNLEDLSRPIINQIGIFLINLSSVIYVSKKNHGSVKSVSYLAGFSFGEYTTLVLSGVIDWRVAMMNMKTIFEEIEKISKLTKYKMLLVSGIQDTKLEVFCKKYKISICSKLTYLTRIVVGKKMNVDKFKIDIEKLKPKTLKNLPFSIPIHSKIMFSIKNKLRTVLNKIYISKPKCHVLSGVLARKVNNAKDVRFIIENLMTSCILWEDLFDDIKKAEYYEELEGVFELYPNNYLTSILKTKNRNLFTKTKKFDDV